MGALIWGRCLVLKYISFIVLTNRDLKKKWLLFLYKADTSHNFFSPCNRNEFTLRHSYVLLQSPLLTKRPMFIFQPAQVKVLVCAMPVEHEADWLTEYQVLDLNAPLWFTELPETMYAPVVELKPKDNFSL